MIPKDIQRVKEISYTVTALVEAAKEEEKRQANMWHFDPWKAACIYVEQNIREELEAKGVQLAMDPVDTSRTFYEATLCAFEEALKTWVEDYERREGGSSQAQAWLLRVLSNANSKT